MADEGNNAWADLVALLENTPVEELPTPLGDVVVIDHSMELTDAFDVLVERNIQGAPVLGEDGKYTGFLDIRDLVSFLVHIGGHMTEGNLLIADLCAAGSGSVVDNVTVSYMSRRNPFKPVPSGSSLREVLNTLCTGVKRVPVVNEEGVVVNVISQTALVRFFQTHSDLIPDSFKEAVVSSEFPNKTVFSADVEVSTLDAFRIIDSKGITGLALVNDAGAMVGTFTGKDLKYYIKNPSYDQLHMPVGKMVKELRMQSEVDIRVPVISVSEQTKIGIVFGRLVATKVHRLFILDDGDTPCGVISLTDILRAFKKNME